MTKVLKNFYAKSLIAILIVFFVFYFAFGALFSSFVPALHSRIAAAEQAAEEAKMAALTGGMETAVLEDVAFVDGVSEVLTTSDGGYIVTASAQGAEGPVVLSISLSADGVVREIVPLFHTEPVGRGDQFLTDSYLFFYEGYSNYGYFNDGSGLYVFDKFDDTNLAMAKMLTGAVAQYKLMNAA